MAFERGQVGNKMWQGKKEFQLLVGTSKRTTKVLFRMN